MALEQQNVAVIDGWFGRLVERLNRGQVEYELRSPSKFIALLAEKKESLQEHAKQAGTVLPDDFDFGFDRYFGTGAARPAPDDVPDLTLQLAMVEKLCEAFFAAEAEAIDVIVREELEAPAAPREGRRRGRSRSPREDEEAEPRGTPPGDAPLFRKLNFTIEFKGRERVITDLLNRLGSQELFTVVTSVSFAKQARDVLEVTPAPRSGVPGAERADAARDKVPERQERIVSGPKKDTSMKIVMQLAVYTFRGE